MESILWIRVALLAHLTNIFIYRNRWKWNCAIKKHSFEFYRNDDVTYSEQIMEIHAFDFICLERVRINRMMCLCVMYSIVMITVVWFVDVNRTIYSVKWLPQYNQFGGWIGFIHAMSRRNYWMILFFSLCDRMMLICPLISMNSKKICQKFKIPKKYYN